MRAIGGVILNQFLQVAHNTDGSLNTLAIQNASGVTSSEVGSANGVASLGSNSLVPSAQLGSGTASSSNFLRGDGTWAVPPAPAAAQNAYLPADDGFFAASWDPSLNTSWGSPNGGAVYFIRMPIRASGTVSNLVLGIESNASTATSTGTFVGLYKVNGSSLQLLSGSSDVGAAFATGPASNTVGLPLPLTTSQSVTAGQVLYGAVLLNMTNRPSLFALPNRNTMNVGTPPWQRTLVYANASQFNVTSLPASVTSSNLDFAGFYSSPVWMALS